MTLGEVVSTERLTTTILNAWPTEICATIKIQAIINPDLCLEEITNIMENIFINHSERSSVPRRGQEPYRKGRDSGRETIMDGRKSVMATVITCHNCKRPGHKKNIVMS